MSQMMDTLQNRKMMAHRGDHCYIPCNEHCWLIAGCILSEKVNEL